jgi:hypothetical protein
MRREKGSDDGIGCGSYFIAAIILVAGYLVWWLIVGRWQPASSPKHHNVSNVASKTTISEMYKKVSGHKPTYVEYYKQSGFALVEYKDKEDTWSETEFVRKHTTRYINLCRKAYKLKGLKNITYTVSTKMEDQKGNTSYDDVLSIEMKKSVFKTYHWSKLIGDQDAMQAAINDGDFDKYYVAPGVEDNVKWNKVWYDGSNVE